MTIGVLTRFVAAALLVSTAITEDIVDDTLWQDLLLDDECAGDDEGACAVAAMQLRASRRAADLAVKVAGADAARSGAGTAVLAKDVPARGASQPLVKGHSEGGVRAAPHDAPAEPVAPPSGEKSVGGGPVSWFRRQVLDHRVGQDDGSAKFALHYLALRAAMFFMGFATTFGAACVIYDVRARSWHGRRFQQCTEDVRRVQEVLLKGEGELPVCPYCVEHIKKSSSKVSHLCGHCFHLDCVNRCCNENAHKVGACLLCSSAAREAAAAPPPASDAAGATPIASPGQDEQSNDDKVAEQAGEAVEGGAAVSKCDGGGEAFLPGDSVPASPQEVRNFLLASLHRKHPELVPEPLVERWSASHIELWLPELTNTEYRSLFQKRLGWGDARGDP